ncbi:hypothetical protein CJ030_MR2G013164 [Morella rubra]|uniref:Uncharacterized protein n=1 Tax=Morella rubra TaxID=262757 RepID=A0A6A1WF05_9ROSI|nr:hypothetical protein CJ030_MR2G013164 [Morella rubra]
MMKVRRKKSPPMKKKVCQFLLMMTRPSMKRIDCALICQAKLHKHFKKFGSKDEALQHRPADTSVENWIACCELFSQPSYQERSRINTNNRAKLKVHHTGGSRPFVWHRKKFKTPRLERQQLQIYIVRRIIKKMVKGGCLMLLGKIMRRWWKSNPNQLQSQEHQKTLTFLLKSLGLLEAAKATIEELKASRRGKFKSNFNYLRHNLRNEKSPSLLIEAKCKASMPREHAEAFKSNFNYLRHNLSNEIRR